MSEKLDPALRDLVDHAEANAAQPVDVLVAVDTPMDPELGRELLERGLHVRSEIGTVLTGSINVQDVDRLADSDRVVKVESSAPLFREPTAGEVRIGEEGGGE
jgi:hypothetical protein